MQKCAKCAKMQKKKKKKISNIEKFFLARFAHSAFYKIHISGAASRRAAVPQFNIQNMFFMPQTSEKLNGAYWFGPVRPSVRPSVCP